MENKQPPQLAPHSPRPTRDDLLAALVTAVKWQNFVLEELEPELTALKHELVELRGRVAVLEMADSE